MSISGITRNMCMLWIANFLTRTYRIGCNRMEREGASPLPYMEHGGGKIISSAAAHDEIQFSLPPSLLAIGLGAFYVANGAMFAFLNAADGVCTQTETAV